MTVTIFFDVFQVLQRFIYMFSIFIYISPMQCQGRKCVTNMSAVNKEGKSDSNRAMSGDIHNFFNDPLSLLRFLKQVVPKEGYMGVLHQRFPLNVSVV